MIESALRVLHEMDSFKKVALMLLTGLTALVIFLGYKFVDNFGVYQSWSSVPHVIKTELPCNLVQIRADHYLVSISFPRPKIFTQRITTFTSSFWVQNKPQDDDFKDLCNGLVDAIYSNQAEKILEPYREK